MEKKRAIKQPDGLMRYYLRILFEEMARGYNLIACFYPGNDNSFAFVGLGVDLCEFPAKYDKVW